LVIEQQTDRALAVADRAVVLDRGAVAFSGSPSEASSVMEGILGVTGRPDKGILPGRVVDPVVGT
jgi:energy-coupling factor transporter ATP-binding protein EcfA2